MAAECERVCEGVRMVGRCSLSVARLGEGAWKGELPEQLATLPASFPIDLAWEVGREACKSQSYDHRMLHLS